MEKIAADSEREFYLRVMQLDDTLGDPFDGELYAVLLWATRTTTAARKHRVCAALIASGCRYVVCGGRESVAWEDAADEAFLAQDLPEADIDENLVMTTSHERESMDDVAFFFTRCTNFGPHDFTRFLVLMMGDNPDIRADLVATLRGYVEAAG